MDNGIMQAPAYGPMESVENSDSYTQITENPFVAADRENTSYFSIDANTASYPNLRSMIKNGYKIPQDAVRVEEILNYFHYDYKLPDDGQILGLSASAFPNPYNPETVLLTIGLAAQEVEFTETRNNLVFLIDVSGSMFGSDRLGLVQQAFMMLAENLNPEDRVSIVTYAGRDAVALEGAYGYEKQKIMAVIEDLEAGGSTAGAAGIQTAYKLAQRYFIEGGNNRVILATDGDFNVGLSSTQDLEKFIAGKRETGVYFSVFGVGYGNLKSDKMETLALKGNGTYSYIDSVNEARRALVEQIGGSMITVAKDVKAGVVFNPEFVESFRLIGYENKLLTQEQFENDTTDAGELGSGHTVTVVYELKLKPAAGPVAEGNLAQVTVKYKGPKATVQDPSQELLLDVSWQAYHGEMTAQDAFVASVVEFALVMRESQFKADGSLQSVLSRLNDLDFSEDAYKEEFRELVKACMDRK
jgi:Ca-activated chloride channel family protein